MSKTDENKEPQNEDIRIEKNGWRISLSLDWPEWVLLSMTLIALSYIVSSVM